MKFKKGQRVAYTGGKNAYQNFFEHNNADYNNLEIIEVLDSCYSVGISEQISLYFDDKVLRQVQNNIKKL